jgi:hypothetical protein
MARLRDMVLNQTGTARVAGVRDICALQRRLRLENHIETYWGFHRPMRTVGWFVGWYIFGALPSVFVAIVNAGTSLFLAPRGWFYRASDCKYHSASCAVRTNRHYLALCSGDLNGFSFNYTEEWRSSELLYSVLLNARSGSLNIAFRASLDVLSWTGLCLTSSLTERNLQTSSTPLVILVDFLYAERTVLFCCAFSNAIANAPAGISVRIAYRGLLVTAANR